MAPTGHPVSKALSQCRRVGNVGNGRCLELLGLHALLKYYHMKQGLSVYHFPFYIFLPFVVLLELHARHVICGWGYFLKANLLDVFMATGWFGSM